MGAQEVGVRTRDEAHPSAGEGRARDFALVVGAIALLALIVRVAYVLLVANDLRLGRDSVWYTLVSGPLSEGKGYLAPGTYFRSGQMVATAGYPPGYPAFLAIVTWIFDPEHETFRLAGAVLGAVTVVLTGYIGRRLGGRVVGLVAASLAAIYPMLIAVDGSLMSETLSIPLLYGAVLMAMIAIDKPAAWRWLVVGALLGLTMLTRADAIITVALLAVASAIGMTGSARRRVLAGGLVFGVAVVIAVPWVVRNDDRVGEPTIATVSSSATIAGANCPSAYWGGYFGFWDLGCSNSERQDVLSEAEWSRETRQRGIDFATDHVQRIPYVVLMRELRVLGLYKPLDQTNLEMLETRSHDWQVAGWICWFPVLVLGAFGVVKMFKIGGAAWPVLAVIASAFMVVAVSYGNQRFRTQAEPALIVAAALTLAQWVPAARRKLASRKAQV
jgi:4-amino-4-deoxy-L-arabinose transferase-like glycosyltransferase